MGVTTTRPAVSFLCNVAYPSNRDQAGQRLQFSMLVPFVTIVDSCHRGDQGSTALQTISLAHTFQQTVRYSAQQQRLDASPRLSTEY